MIEKIFVDTNILVYAHDPSSGDKHIRAQEIVFELWESGLGCLSMQVLQEFYVTVTRKVGVPLEETAAAKIVRDLSTWMVHEPRTEDLQSAFVVQGRYRISFWDAMIIQSARLLGCDVIWTEDLNQGQVYDGVRVQNPFV